MNNPLVSVVVLTFNSSQFILQTLDSIKKQDYKNLELIVSDDCSSDNTCDIVDSWISENSSFFVRAILVRSHKNRGTSFNYNNGIANSKGFFIKTLDGDDLLSESNSISNYVRYMQTNKWRICISDVEVFTTDSVDLDKYRELYSFYFKCVQESHEEQLSRITSNLHIADPGLFMTRDLYKEVGGFDENYMLLEEWPFFFNVMNNGGYSGAIPEKLVNYRICKKIISHTKKSKAKIQIYKDLYDFFRNCLFKNHIKRGNIYFAIRTLLHYYLQYIKEKY